MRCSAPRICTNRFAVDAGGSAYLWKWTLLLKVWSRFLKHLTIMMCSRRNSTATRSDAKRNTPSYEVRSPCRPNLISLSETPHDHDCKTSSHLTAIRSSTTKNNLPSEIRSPCKPNDFKQFWYGVASLDIVSISIIHSLNSMEFTSCGPSRSRGHRWSANQH